MPSAVLRVWMPSLGAGCGAGCCAGCCFLKIRTLILLDRTINININIYIYVYVIYIYIYYIICIYIYTEIYKWECLKIGMLETLLFSMRNTKFRASLF
jgi:hypothetical protein